MSRTAPSASERAHPPPPSALLMLLEGRAPWEFAALLAASPFLRRLPPGDGHPVLVLPGLGAADLSTLPLRRFLQDQGYAPQAWELGFNLGPRAGVLERCIERLRRLHAEQGRPVSLVGWSLGGVFAREAAKAAPKAVRCVITLGSPFGGHPSGTRAWRLYEWASGQRGHDPLLAEQLRRLPPVPTTSIYSRSDGIVSWRCSLNEAGPQAENLEVPASHLGMGVNPLVLYAVADRLAQDPARWQPFEPRGLRRWFFRTGDAGAGAGAAAAAP